MQKQLSKIAGLLLAIALPAWAAMTDPAAIKLARTTWGSQAMIGTARDITASNWTRLVGFRSGGCQQSFTAVGTGFNTWDAAFADAAAHPFPVKGPFRGTVTIMAQIWDNVAVTGAQFFIDSVARPQLLPPTISPYFIAQEDIDLSTTAPGLHVLCVRAWDADNSQGRSHAFLFMVDPIAGAAGATFFLNEKTQGPPSASLIQISQR